MATIDKTLRYIKVHNVVARTFHGPPPSSKHTPDHINQDPSDNRRENLRWATMKEQGRNRRNNRRVVQLDLVTGAHLAVFDTIAAAAEAAGIFATSISCVVASDGRRTAGGFGWKYADETSRL
jgi:hypothetical protein